MCNVATDNQRSTNRGKSKPFSPFLFTSNNVRWNKRSIDKSRTNRNFGGAK
jgi:hypothetical protein